MTTPIIAAGRRGDVQVLEIEVAALAETFGVIRGEILPSAKDEHGNTVLHASSELGLTDILAWTLDQRNFPLQPGLRSTFIEQRNGLGDTAVNTAARSNQPTYLATLLSYGAYPTTNNGFGFTAVHYAATANSEELTTLLLAHNASPSAISRSRDTPLHIATRSGNIVISQLLLRAGATPDITNASGDAPFHLAVRAGNWPPIQLLAGFGAPKDQHNAVNGDTPLHIAVRMGNVDMVERLLRAEVNVRERNWNGLTPFELARLKGSEEVQDAFLNAGRW
ncbi:ankyrin repeat-containing domain protein [Parachaetomium inaequale]|uniref:Ankyrin repeat-containing domain protein n=1 Tax=Parachaetomium inaequale TaxID=2588326 RepID=A0AAN6SN88_9PEZI|nr:ankyrin repeat-containing domain protein [Parachaetomium inaequale]